ncbi:glycosyl transferase family 2 [Candidatus Aerophobetes bacterium]|uniref:Glycosyl transferase family 2 n=1 Tax=Aerophobetes bacterium TaxID=2030807 RepID=A0A662DDQ0_UNCAE|nr:MAG: glycosyl transferase family 2 [Candidatus Aerophobetes bacterium]
MKLQNALSEEAREKLEQVGKADILVGIPSYNNEKTIGQVVRAVQCGLAKYFPNEKAMIMNSDGGSTDRTREIVKQTSIYTDLDTILVEHPVHPARSLAAPYYGLPGKGSAFKAIFETAYELNVVACVVVDSDLRSITPEWIQLLAGPVLLKGYDYVAPYYSRHKYDGTITNSIAYPLTRALYGKRIRQPIGGDFGFSRRMVENFLSKDVWGTDVARYGIDIWMTTIAINEGFKICQSFLGAKIHDGKEPSQSLGPMFKQVVGTLFYLMTQYEDNWKNVKGSRPVAMYGFRSEVLPEPVTVKVEAMIEKFRMGVEENKDFWCSILPGEDVERLVEITRFSREKFNFPMDLWAKIIYDFAVAYKNNTKIISADTKSINEKLVTSLIPLYFGRTASFVKETRRMSSLEAERVVEKVCEEFERMKPYLIKKWFKE